MSRVYARIAAVVIAAVVAGTAGYVFYQRNSDPYAACRSAAISTGAGAIGGPFTLVDESGKTVTDKDVITRPSLVYFGYTFCPDVCPLDNSRNGEAVDILEEKGFDVTPVFISVDPERDTLKALKDFTTNMHPRMIGLTGSPEQIQAAAKAYKVYFKVHDHDAGDKYYLVDHSTFTYLVLPGKGFVDFFRHEDTADQIADRVACYLDKG